MSRWSDLSKSVGWDAPDHAMQCIPTVREAERLATRISDNDLSAMTELLLVNRFGRWPTVAADYDAIRICADALPEGRLKLDAMDAADEVLHALGRPGSTA